MHDKDGMLAPCAISKPAVPEDEALVLQMAHGDADGLAELYRRHGRSVLRYLGCLLAPGSLDDAEDLCQEVFLTALRSAASFRGEGSVRSWLLGIAIRKARASRRKSSIRSKLFGLFAASVRSASAPLGEAESESQVLERFARAVAALSPGLREVLLLHAGEGLDCSEIASMLDLRAGAVWTRLHRARRAVGAALEKEGT
jgi:RNA polymerase sigma-70 factor (ECF subfamily)